MAQSHTVCRWQGWVLRPAGMSRLVPVADMLGIWLVSPHCGSRPIISSSVLFLEEEWLA